jgi:hypothetical protein
MQKHVGGYNTMQSLKSHRCYKGTCCLHLLGRWISQARNSMKQAASRLQTASYCLLLWLTLWPWRLRWHVPPKHWSTFTRLHCVTSQKIKMFITKAVRTSNTIYTVSYCRLKDWLTDMIFKTVKSKPCAIFHSQVERGRCMECKFTVVHLYPCGK